MAHERSRSRRRHRPIGSLSLWWFSPLLVIASISATAQQTPTTIQQPTFGVAIDAQGVLEAKSSFDSGQNGQARKLAARVDLPEGLGNPVAGRKVSLVRLERTVCQCIESGQPPDEVMRHLAGLTRIQYVCCLPEVGEVLVIGPAEGWTEDPMGRSVGIESGRPTLRLDDLVVALRAFPPDAQANPFIGCTIDPTADGLQRMVQFQRSIPRSIPVRDQQAAAVDIAKGLRESLGMANVRLFGVSPKTHLARILVEADYRMKLIGVGLEPPPVPMTTFVSALRSARGGNLQRWWFTPNYDCLRVIDNRRCLELIGQGVQLQTEDKVIGPNGQLTTASKKPGRASALYAKAFTQKYPEIAARSPVFAQLRNAIDMLVIAAYCQDEDFYGQCNWSPQTLLDESQLPTETYPAPTQAACVANAVWKQSRLFAPAGGGVSIVPRMSLEENHLQRDEKGALNEVSSNTKEGLPKNGWWWD